MRNFFKKFGRVLNPSGSTLLIAAGIIAAMAVTATAVYQLRTVTTQKAVETMQKERRRLTC